MHGGQTVRFVGHHGKIPHGYIGRLYEKRPPYVPYLPTIDADRQGLTVHVKFKFGDHIVDAVVSRQDVVVCEKPKGSRNTSIKLDEKLSDLMDNLVGEFLDA